ncbi:phage tail tape measure protein [Pseudomonas fluorescens]|uniref:phage tail tape measure protein n=1 Tax=Pseudomonas fluorescens TaxID=294 RepID=UPI003D1943FD
MSFEAYSVAIKLSLINHVSAGMLMVSKSLHGTGQDADKLNAKLASIGKQAAIGGAMFGGGLALASMFKAPLDEAKKFQTEMAKFSLYGMSDAVNAEAERFVKGMNSIGTSITTNMKLFTEAQGVFRESGLPGMEALEGAKIAAPVLSKIAYATSGLSEESQAVMKTSSMAMMRYIEDSGGLKSPKRFNELADAGWKMTQTSGGSVNWEQLRQFKARGGIAAMNMADDAVAMMEPLITMLKGSTAGVSLRTAYNRLNGIVKIPNQVAHELVKNNIWDNNKVIWNAQGGIKAFKGNPLKDAELFSHNPIEFYEKVIMPMHKRMGITTDAAIGQSNAMLFGSTGGALFTLADKNIEKLHHSLEAQHKALGIDASVEKTRKTLSGREVELQAKWKDLLLILGDQVLPMAIVAVTKLNEGIVSLTKWIGENPEKVKAFTYALIGLSAFLITGGLINMVIAAGRGFWLLAKALIFVAGGGLAPLIPWLARMGTYLVMLIMNAGKAIIWLGRAMLMNPIGLVITAIAVAAFLLWNNWKEISGALTLMWGDLKTGFVKLFHGDIGGAFKSFALIFLTGWQTIFNTLIAGANTILPDSHQISKMHFADDYRKDISGGSGVVAPVPSKSFSKDPIIVHLNADGKKLAEVVVDRMTREASRPQTGTNGFDPQRSMLMPGTPSATYPR